MHLEALQRLGATLIHRRSFAPVRQQLELQAQAEHIARLNALVAQG